MKNLWIIKTTLPRKFDEEFKKKKLQEVGKTLPRKFVEDLKKKIPRSSEQLYREKSDG